MGHENDNNSSAVNSSIITTPQWSTARKLNIQQFMPREQPPARNLRLGERLVLAREAIGLKQGQFALKAGLSATQYNQWESGANYPEVDNATKLCDRHGLTLDWIYRGKYEGLPTWLSDIIRALEQGRRVQAALAEHDQAVKVIHPPKRRRNTA